VNWRISQVQAERVDLGHACAPALLSVSRSSRHQAAARTVNGARITKIG
jgi:hypothetical protein